MWARIPVFFSRKETPHCILRASKTNKIHEETFVILSSILLNTRLKWMPKTRYLWTHTLYAIYSEHICMCKSIWVNIMWQNMCGHVSVSICVCAHLSRFVGRKRTSAKFVKTWQSYWLWYYKVSRGAWVWCEQKRQRKRTCICVQNEGAHI